MKHVLFITYYFPPLGGVGAQRVLRLLPHLKSLGWSSSILTVANGLDGELRDESLLKAIPSDVDVYRAPLWDIQKPMTWLRRWGGERITGMYARWAEYPPPDRHLGWLPFAVQKANQILKNNPIDAIITVSAPYTAHLTGWILQRLHGRPWIADLRDEWSDNPVRKPLFGWQTRLDRWLESHVLKSADRILMTTPSYCHAVAQRLPLSSRRKVMLLTNGYDHRDFAAPPRALSPGQFHILYCGSLYGPQNPSHFLQALIHVIERGDIPKDRVQVTFVGRASRVIQSQVLDPLTANGLVASIPFASHRATVQLMMGADVLLLLIGTERGAGNIPAKTFEYLAAHKPILALVPTGGDAARLLQALDGETVVDPDDKQGIEQALIALYQRWAVGRLSTDQKDIGPYESKALTERLVGCLNGLTSKNSTPSPEPAELEGRRVSSCR